MIQSSGVVAAVTPSPARTRTAGPPSPSVSPREGFPGLPRITTTSARGAGKLRPRYAAMPSTACFTQETTSASVMGRSWGAMETTTREFPLATVAWWNGPNTAKLDASRVPVGAS